MELGSEFNLSLNNLDKTTGNLTNYLGKYNVSWYEYGRTAIKQVPIDTEKYVLLPEFICESVINCFNHDKVRFYRINESFEIDIEDLQTKLDNVGTIYICHYFGYVHSIDKLHSVRELADTNGILIIEDTTQSLFSVNKLTGDYAVASIRKWMQVPQGGVLYSSRRLPDTCVYEKSTDNYRACGMILKDLFLNEGMDTNSKYRKIFSECEKRVDDSKEVKIISDFAYYITECVDIEQMVHIRKENADYLQQKIKKIGITPIREFNENECALVLPIRVNNRDDFRKYLIENRIYCAVHWPFDGLYESERSGAKYNAETLISLPIDQRYSTKELDYMIEVISNYGGNLLF